MAKAHREMRCEYTNLIRGFGDLNVPRNLVEARMNPPHGVSQIDWDFLVTLVSSDEFKKRSETNKKNREKLKYGHRGGSKPFVFHQTKNCEESGEPLGEIDLFKNTHYSQSKGWVTDEAERMHVSMEEIRSMQSSEGSISESEIVKSILGERSGYIKGRGWGPRPTKSDGVGSSKAAEVRAYKEELHTYKEALNAQQEQINDLKQQVTSLLSMMRAPDASNPEFASRSLEDPSQSPPRDVE